MHGLALTPLSDDTVGAQLRVLGEWEEPVARVLAAASAWPWLNATCAAEEVARLGRDDAELTATALVYGARASMRRWRFS